MPPEGFLADVRDHRPDAATAAAAFVNAYRAWAVRCLMADGTSQQDAENAVQQGLMNILRTAANGSLPVKFTINECAYVMTVIRRARGQQACGNQRHPQASLDGFVYADPAAVDPAAAADTAEQRRAVRTAIAELPPMYRALFVMIYLGNCSRQEVAAALGIPISKVKQRHFRGLLLLRELLPAGLFPESTSPEEGVP